MRLRCRAAFEKLLEIIVILLMLALTIEVILGVTYRKLGWSLAWYDEIASINLAWLTYYGAALAALKRAHIGVPTLINSLPPGLRLPLILTGEAFVFGFFLLLAWTGWHVLGVLATDFLVSLPTISVMYTQSVIPIGAALYLIAEALSLPDLIADAKSARRDAPER